MKKCIIVIIALLCSFLCANMLFAAANTWTQKTDFGGTARQLAVGFSIGSKGYIGTGQDGSSAVTDFWEYDPSASTWTQKAAYEGTARYNAVGFSIGSKGYIVTGRNNNPSGDLWEYDPAANTWTRKADFGGVRTGAVGFSIGSKGYIGTGADLAAADPNKYKKDFWEYDPATDTWTKKADFGGAARVGAVGFSIGSKGYIGTGWDNSSESYTKDFWEYDPAADTWTRKADFGGAATAGSVGFSIGSNGYIGTGGWTPNDFWEYDPAANAWTQKANFGGIGRGNAVGFSIGSKGYVGTGDAGGGSYMKDFWEYRPSAATANVKGDINGDGVVSLADAILAMQVISRMSPSGIRTGYATANVDVNGDAKIGLAEVIFSLQSMAELRSASLLVTSSDADQSVTLTGSTSALPAGVSAASLTLTPKAATDVPAAPVEASLLLAVECEPTGTQFSQPVTLTFKLSWAHTAGEVLTLYFLSGGAWTPAGTSAIVGDTGLTASAAITHFSTYGLFVPVNAALPGDKYFTFAGGVNDGGSPSEIMYDDVNSLLFFPHSDALSVAQAYTGIMQAPYGIYQNSNGLNPPIFTAAAGTVYVLRSTMPTLQYYKLQVISATVHNGSKYGVVTFKYEKILPLDILNAVGRWLFPDNSQLAMLPTTVGLDYTTAGNVFYAIDGNYTNQTTLEGTFTTWNPSQVTGTVTVTLSLSLDGKLNASMVGQSPLGTVTLTGGVKQ